ncbi:MAG: M4 family metallopeptidase [Weeksellaceae bacterium]|jgi:Zn-dependent metalloprotease|nr:M4 family metallopeptidase [Weeksellaceae bacterium]MDX9704648.1 M4 family metallopeptidase [Weeksellaceae bacterium]
MKKLLLSSLFAGLSVMNFAQDYLKSDYVKSKTESNSGKIKFLAFTPSSLISINESEAVLKNILHTTNENKLEEIKRENDPFGGTHIHYKQYYKGTEVLHHHYAVHTKNEIIHSVNGYFNDVTIPISVSSLKTPTEIYELGLTYLENSYLFLEGKTPKSRLVVLTKDLNSKKEDRYVYVFPMISINPNRFENVYLDALTGEVLRKESLFLQHTTKQMVWTEEQWDYLNKIKVNTKQSQSFIPFVLDVGNAETRYSGLQEIETLNTEQGFLLQDEDRYLQTKNFGQDYLVVVFGIVFGMGVEEIMDLAENYVDEDNNWTSEEYATTKDDGALEAHWAFSQTYDFFKTEYDRDGFDNENSEVVSFIHTTFFGSPLNAAWMSLSAIDPELTGGFMFIGDGDYNSTTQTGSYDIFAPMDVIAHEYAHGVDSAAGGLVYERESGALNEGFSDIWGASIEAKQAPEKQRWIMGEDFVMIEPAGIRSLEAPKMFNQPDTYQGTYWVDASENCTPSEDNDNCGVHTNSGVLNYWFYLISDGGAGTNDNGYEYEVSGFGIKKAADLVYSTQLNYIQSQSKFEDVRDYTLQEAAVLYGENSEEVTTVFNAWCAVGVTTGEACDNMKTINLSENSNGIYPNPVSNILYLNSDKNTVWENYKITNTAGQIVLQGSLKQQEIQVSALPKGVYVLTLKSGTSVQNFKFVKK